MKTTRGKVILVAVAAFAFAIALPTIRAASVIIDNRDINSTIRTGNWSASGGTDPYSPDGFYPKSLWSRNGATFAYRFEPPEPGTYQVSMWWSGYPSRAPNVDVSIVHDGGTAKLTVNQQANSGLWNGLGTFQFTTLGHVVIHGAYGDDISTCADAVKFDFVSPVPVIVDNRSASVDISGKWLPSGAPNSYDRDSMFGRDGSTFTWKFIPSRTDDYEVSMWWTEWPSRGTDIPVSIVHNGGVAVHSINQQDGGGEWNQLGTYRFVAGQPYEVTVTSVAGPASTCADAVKFAPVGDRVLDRVEIIGPDVVRENTTTQYECVAHYTDGTSALVTDPAVWQVVYGPATISGGGELTTQDVTADTGSQIRATYTESGNARSATHTLTIKQSTELAEVIVDNGAAATSFTGWWSVSGGTDPYGADSLWSRDGSTYTWSFQPQKDGYYEVSMWWSGWSTRTTSAPVLIENAGEDVLVNVNQQQNAGRWNPLSTVYMISGVTYDVTIIAAEGSASTAADAVRFSMLSTVGPSVLDNGDAGTSSTGWWETSGGPNPYGSESLWSRKGSTYTWTLQPSVTKTYQVQMWWTQYSTRTSAAKITINHANGQKTVYVDQRTNGGRWNTLAEVELTAGAAYDVTITASDSNTTSTCADAVRFIDPLPNITTVAGAFAEPPEHVFFMPGFAWDYSAPVIRNFLAEINADKITPDLWTYTSPEVGRTYVIYIAESIAGMKRALTTKDAHVLYFGHSNYGLGGVFTVESDMWNQSVPGIEYVDDDRIFNYSAPWVRVWVNALRVHFPDWWPVFQDGTSAAMPYDFGDPRGNPPHNYYVTYRIDGDPTHYLLKSPRHEPIERFPEASQPAWYAADGSTPDPNNPDHLKYFITNPAADPNADPPDKHYGNYVIIRGYQNQPEITQDNMAYKQMLYVGCTSGHYYTETFQQGRMFYALQTSDNGPAAVPLYLKAYLDGKTDHEIWETMQNLSKIFDYYDFRKRPEDQN